MAAENEGIEQNPPPMGNEIDGNDGAAVIFMTSVTDLNADCLEKIFSYLNVKDLLNVADSNKCLKKDAELAFKKKNKKVELIPVMDCIFSTFNSAWFQLFRCFGHLISKLTISYRYVAAKKRIHLNHYIVNYCAATLIELFIEDGDENTFKDLDKSFANVKHVSINSHGMLGQLLCLKSWFPNMNQLYLNLLDPETEEEIKTTNFEAAMEMNPQLEHLNIRNSWNVRILQSISKLPALKTLSINIKKCDIEHFENADIHMGNVKIFNFSDDMITLNVGLKSIFEATTIIPPIQFDQLEELTLPNRDFLNNLTFFKMHPSIKKLILNSKLFEMTQLSENELLLVKNSFPSLQELHLDFHSTIDGAVLITKALLPTLNSFSFHLHGQMELVFRLFAKSEAEFQIQSQAVFDDAVLRFSSDWHVFMIDTEKPTIKLERKIKSN